MSADEAVVERVAAYEHVCGGCFMPISQHPERRCDCEDGHWPALCCPGCPCRSFEEAHGG